MAKAKTAKEFDRRFDAGEDIFDLAEIDSERSNDPAWKPNGSTSMCWPIFGKS